MVRIKPSHIKQSHKNLLLLIIVISLIAIPLIVEAVGKNKAIYGFVNKSDGTPANNSEVMVFVNIKYPAFGVNCTCYTDPVNSTANGNYTADLITLNELGGEGALCDALIDSADGCGDNWLTDTPESNELWAVANGSGMDPPQGNGQSGIDNISCYNDTTNCAGSQMLDLIILAPLDNRSPNVTLISPPNASTWSNNFSVVFEYNVTDESAISNCELVINGTINQTDNAVTINTSNFFYVNMSNGEYEWYVNCTDAYGNEGNSETWFLTLNVLFAINISLDKTDYPDPTLAGENLSYSIIFSNTGQANATNITIIETYPLNTSFVSSVPAPNVSNNTWFFDVLEFNETRTINITVQIDDNLTNGTVLTNFVNLTYFNQTDFVSVTTEENTTITSITYPEFINIFRLEENISSPNWTENRHVPVLNWSAVPGADGYNVYYSDNAIEMMNLDINNLSSNITKIAGIVILNYTDYNASLDTVRFYRVSAFQGPFESISPLIFCKQLFDFLGLGGTGNSYHRSNWIGFVCNVTGRYDAELFLDEIGTSAVRMKELNKANATDYTVLTHNKDTLFGNFNLIAGPKYTVETSADDNNTIVGYAVLSPYPMALKGLGGTGNSFHRQNWYSIPYTTANYYAESLLDAIGTPAVRIKRLVKNNATDYTVEVHNKDTAFNNYSLDIGIGYVIETSADANFTPQG